nr:SIR2 family protein [Mycoplasma phocoeninasale]
MYNSTIDDNQNEKAVFNNYEKLIDFFCDYLQSESNERPKRINVFTTNYDLLFERSFDKFLLKNPLIYFNDGSRGFFKKYISNQNFYLGITHSGYNDNYRREVPTINLFKLHGSISWTLSSTDDSKKSNINMIEVCEKNDVIEKIKETITELEKAHIKSIDDILKNSENKNIEHLIKALNSFSENLNSDYESFMKLYLEIPIINPDKYKFQETVLEQHYYQMIRSFSYELEKKQSILIVFGFSFADEHLREILKRSLVNPELRVIIICYSQKDKEKFRNLFRGYKNIDYLPENFVKDNREINGDFAYLLFKLGCSDDEK